MKAAEIKKQVLAELDTWMSAFNAKDLEAWSKTHNFPHVRIAGGKLTYWHSRKEYIEHFSKPDMFESLEELGWHHSKWVSRDFDLITKDKVHVSVIFQRYNSDNKPHSKFEALYILTKENEKWGIQFRSSLAP